MTVVSDQDAALTLGGPLPSPEVEGEVLALLDDFLAAIAARDASAMRALCASEGWAAHTRHGRTYHQRLWDLPDRLPSGAATVEEKVHDPVVLIDEDLAVIWCKYDVFIDGEAHHWGTNIVSLIRDHESWMITAITDNGRSGLRPPVRSAAS